MKKVLVPVLGFVAGVLSGIALRLGYGVLMTRPGAPGGEVLIPILVLILLCYGYTVGRITEEERDTRWAWRDGYREGYRKGLADRMSKARPLYLDADWNPSGKNPSGR